jgi:uncharacterized MAPEG superfamily protein
MTLSLWMLLAFAGWTLLVLLVGVGVPRWTLILTGRAMLTSFPGDTPHGAGFYRRAVRAHANCIENLPVFGAIVLIAVAAHVASPLFDKLAAATMAARVAQTSIHLRWTETNVTVGWRFSFFTVQALAMIAMGVQIAAAGAGYST